jgi:hypothetical protein
MKTQTLTLLATTMICLNVSAKAETKAVAKATASKCLACDTNEKMTKEIQKLNYAKEDDKFKGESIALKAVDNLQAFDKISKKTPDREAIFTSLLTLSREAAPYDTESQLAQVLSDQLKKDKDLKKSYDAFIKGMPKAAKTAEQCKSENFEKTVGEQICLGDAGIGSKDNGDAKKTEKVMKCTTKFDFIACLKVSKK